MRPGWGWATAGSLHKAGDDQLLALMQACGVYRVGGNGVACTRAGGRPAYETAAHNDKFWSGSRKSIRSDARGALKCVAYIGAQKTSRLPTGLGRERGVREHAAMPYVHAVPTTIHQGQAMYVTP